MPKPKIYFACSIRGGGDTSAYKTIISLIKGSGGECLSEIFVNEATRLDGSPLSEREIYQRDIEWIEECDGIIAEVTNPSLGVGYELAYAEKIGKPILTVFSSRSGKKLSAMIAGNPSFTNKNYDDLEALKPPVENFIASLRQDN